MTRFVRLGLLVFYITAPASLEPAELPVKQWVIHTLIGKSSKMYCNPLLNSYWMKGPVGQEKMGEFSISFWLSKMPFNLI